jgi:hypothetical protein
VESVNPQAELPASARNPRKRSNNDQTKYKILGSGDGQITILSVPFKREQDLVRGEAGVEVDVVEFTCNVVYLSCPGIFHPPRAGSDLLQ